MHHVAHLVHDYGLLVVAGFIGLESLGLPLPGETALIVGSVIAGRTHELSIVAVILVAAGASIVGRIIGYMIVAQFVPFLRAIAGILAGANRMPWHSYLVACTVGAILWSLFFGIGAYWFGREFAHLARSWGLLSGPSGWVVFCIAAGIVLIALAVFVARHEAQLAAKAERALPGPLQLP